MKTVIADHSARYLITTVFVSFVQMGDEAYHATAALDYRDTRGQMRMAATVYVADIGEDNIDKIMKDYTQHYPPRDRPDLLLAMAGSHWHPTNPTARLPSPGSPIPKGSTS